MSKSSATRPNRESVSKRIGKRMTAAILNRDNHRCVYCTQTAEESGARLQLDHIIPRRGDATARYLDVPENLLTCCARCNRAKSDMSISQWTRYAAAKLALTLDARAIHAHACSIKLAA